MKAALVKKHSPQACIVADRFHVIRRVTIDFLACWNEIEPTGAKNRGLVSLICRHRHHLTRRTTGAIVNICQRKTRAK
jgi:transposase